MEVKVLERKENPLLMREEIVLEISADATPSRREVRETVVAHTGASPELVVVKRIHGRAGSRTFRAEVYVYKDRGALLMIEPKYILRRNGVIEDGEAQAQ